MEEPFQPFNVRIHHVSAADAVLTLMKAFWANGQHMTRVETALSILSASWQ